MLRPQPPSVHGLRGDRGWPWVGRSPEACRHSYWWTPPAAKSPASICGGVCAAFFGFIVGPRRLCRTLGVGARTLARHCDFRRRPRLRCCICTCCMFPKPVIFCNIMFLAVLFSNISFSLHFTALSHPQQSSSVSPSCSCPTMPASAVWFTCLSRRLPRPATPTMSSLSPPPSPRT